MRIYSDTRHGPTPFSNDSRRRTTRRGTKACKQQSLPHAAVLLLLLAGLVGCKEATVGPERVGSIAGRVLAFETRAPIEGVSITTSPPTSALVTGEDGRFVLEGIEAGNYTITAQAPDYEANTVTVSVRAGQITPATIFLEEAEEDTSAAALGAEIVNWSTHTEGDSAFVRVQYRASNTGTEDIATYEIYFRILAGDAKIEHEETGEDLEIDETDVALFETYTLNEAARKVTVYDYEITEGVADNEET